MVLKECPNYEDCLRIHRNLNPSGKREFSCDGCNCYKCYELGFAEGAKGDLILQVKNDSPACEVWQAKCKESENETN